MISVILDAVVKEYYSSTRRTLGRWSSTAARTAPKHPPRYALPVLHLWTDYVPVCTSG
jgi:hypothetical protein